MSVPLYINLQERLKAEREEVQLKDQQIRALCEEYRLCRDALQSEKSHASEIAEILKGKTEVEEESERRVAEAQREVENLQQAMSDLQPEMQRLQHENDEIRHELDNEGSSRSTAEEKIDRMKQVIRNLREENKRYSVERLTAVEESREAKRKTELMEQQKSKVLEIIQEERVRSERMRKLVNLHDTQKERAEKNFKKSQIEVKDLQRKLKLFELNLKLKTVAFDEASGKVNHFEKRVQELVRTNLQHEKSLQGCYRSEREQETLLSQLRVQNEHLRNLVMDLSAKLRNIDGVFSDDVSSASYGTTEDSRFRRGRPQTSSTIGGISGGELEDLVDVHVADLMGGFGMVLSTEDEVEVEADEVESQDERTRQVLSQYADDTPIDEDEDEDEDEEYEEDGPHSVPFYEQSGEGEGEPEEGEEEEDKVEEEEGEEEEEEEGEEEIDHHLDHLDHLDHRQQDQVQRGRIYEDESLAVAELACGAFLDALDSMTTKEEKEGDLMMRHGIQIQSPNSLESRRKTLQQSSKSIIQRLRTSEYTKGLVEAH
jgi:hypothetical protein